jgi:hypothetical protein
VRFSQSTPNGQRSTPNVYYYKKSSGTGPGASFMYKQRNADYFFTESTSFLVESIMVLVESIMVLEESDTTVFTESVFTIVVESVVVVLDPDPQAAKRVMEMIVSNFFILKV